MNWVSFHEGPKLVLFFNMPNEGLFYDLMKIRESRVFQQISWKASGRVFGTARSNTRGWRLLTYRSQIQTDSKDNINLFRRADSAWACTVFRWRSKQIASVHRTLCGLPLFMASILCCFWKSAMTTMQWTLQMLFIHDKRWTTVDSIDFDSQ